MKEIANEKECKYCKTKLKPNAKFCSKCGKKVEQDEIDNTESLDNEEVLNKKSSNQSGDSLSLEKRETIASPSEIIASEFKKKISGLKQLFSFKGNAKKILIAIITLAFTWLFTMIWQKVCADKIMRSPFVVRLLAFLSFANGGVSNNPLYMLGGLTGKMVFASSIFSIIINGIKLPKKGVSKVLDSLKNFGNVTFISGFLYGAGGAFILYNFFCGKSHIDFLWLA